MVGKQLPPAAVPTEPPNRGPIFFCAPASKDDLTAEIESTLNDHGVPAPWPPETKLRARIINEASVHSIVVDLVKKASHTWTTDISQTISVQWVNDDPADIRVSFDNDKPSWSCVGVRAKQYPSSKATMNFALGGWQTEKIVFTHAHITRMALHLFGHALGLPHAKVEEGTPWDEVGLSKIHGSFLAGVVKKEEGSGFLKDSSSIMHFDKPREFNKSGSDILKGGSVIDIEAKRYLYRLYPDVFSTLIMASQVPGFNRDTRVALQRISTNKTSNAITALSRIDVGLGENFRVRSLIPTVSPKGSQTPGFDVKIESWANTPLIDADCNVLAFEEDDSRIQAGSALGAPQPNFETYVPFAVPFARTPTVVTFISGVDTAKDIRLHVFATDIDTKGFILNIRTWDNTKVFGVNVSWLAHEIEESSIRSGAWEHPLRVPGGTIREESRLQYSTPMVRKPRHVFCGFSYIDVQTFHFVRIDFRATDWDAASINCRASTWNDESRFYRVNGSYVAIL